MPEIRLLTQDTIDKIAAGEVVDRPASVVKELVENAIDAGATAVTVEIKEGGISFIRITDNGCGIPADQIRVAFLRHSTSKIRQIEDLLSVSSLGFRGEALSSISAVARVELITKTRESLTGTRYVIEGSKEVSMEEIGAPEGTTFLVRDLFYNTPARRKFLKTPQTEGNYISEIVEKLALSHPDVSFKFILNNQTKLHTSGNGSRRDLIYHVFGREVNAALLEVNLKNDFFEVQGFIGKPVITRGNRNYENYFVNGRYVKSSLLAKGIEDAYKSFLMQHQYPFTVLYFTFQSEGLDVNVHPAKMELRFGHNQEVYKALYEGLYQVLSHREMIPVVPVKEEKPAPAEAPEKPKAPEPFESRRLNDIRRSVAMDSPYEIKYPNHDRRGPGVFLIKDRGTAAKEAPKSPEVKTAAKAEIRGEAAADLLFGTGKPSEPEKENAKEVIAKPGSAKAPEKVPEKVPEKAAALPASKKKEVYEEITLGQISADFLSQESRKKHKIIGQLFQTYWLVEFEDKLFVIDQHAAHEKVLYERTMKQLEKKEFTSQRISPPIVMSLDAHETEMLEKYRSQIERLGYEVEHFGGREYMISAIPGNLYNLDMKDLFIEMLDDFSEMGSRQTPELILEKVASMSCKAAVKGNDKLSLAEIESLIDELLTLENPYNCPHGRPTIISMTKYEIEKKFKRIV